MLTGPLNLNKHELYRFIRMYIEISDQMHGQAEYEPRCEKTGLQGFQPGQTQTGLYSHRRWLET